MGLKDRGFGHLQRIGQGGGARVVEVSAAAFEVAEYAARDAGSLGELGLRQSGHYSQISEGSFGLGHGQKSVYGGPERCCGQAQGVDQW